MKPTIFSIVNRERIEIVVKVENFWIISKFAPKMVKSAPDVKYQIATISCILKICC